MDFIDEVRTRSGRFAQRIDRLDTEEATKSALVLPFIQMLGYDIFDPSEVVPEFTADVGSKKGEKVDYALVQDDKPVILIECKKYGTDLDAGDVSQLLRYFTVTEARFGILTDGIIYRFFSDLEEPNMMDPRPFFEFNMLDFTESHVQELKRFTRSNFDMSEIVGAARDLKYTTEIKRVLAAEFAGPSDDFIRFIIGKVYKGRATVAVREMFLSLAHQALTQFLNERIHDRLQSAMEQQETPPSPPQPTPEPEIVTTEEEWQGFYAVKSILRNFVDVTRITLHDTKSGYCAMLLDNNIRKRICRLYFDGSQKYLGVLDNQRKEKRIPIEGIDSLFDHADLLREIVHAYDNPSAATVDTEEAT